MDDVEKIARAIAKGNWGCETDWQDFQADARAAIAALRQPTPEPTRRTVKVRVAVAVQPDGVWGAWGRAATDDALAKSNVYDEGDALYWLTAELPIPEDVTVQATVEQPDDLDDVDPDFED